jgi:AcrR family transcriptional regulator
MGENKKAKAAKTKIFHGAPELPARALGRKRDHTVDGKILDAAIDVLAEAGFDGMTMDMVAARAKAGKATVYRRWASKAQLVRDALARMNRTHLELDRMPDTGTLRGDLFAVLKPQSIEEKERKLRVIAGLGSFSSEYQEFAEAGHGIFDSWVAVNRALMQRAVDRRELPGNADIEMACQVITSMATYRGLIQRKPMDKAFFTAFIDGILLPALKHPQ